MSERTENGFRCGAITAEALMEFRGYALVRVKVGDTILTIQATPKGRRVGVAIDDGAATVRIARRRKGGVWE